MPKLSQLADNSVTALMSKLGFGTAKQSLLRYVQAGDGTDLSLAYDRAIADGRRTLRLPEGTWDWSAPKDYVSGLKFIGDEEIKTSGVGGSKINAPNGFLKNDNTTRKQIVIKNLHIIGTNVASSVGVDGPFGGVISGCKIEGFDDLIRNLSGYLVMYKRNAYADALRGINTADANGTVIEQSHFNADVGIQITTRDGTPQTGVNSGLPLIIRENNFNAADGVTACLKVRGQLKITDNYFEKFSGSVSTTFIDIEVNRFDHQGVIVENNELNGQSANVIAIALNGSHNGLDNPCNGRICHNRIIGCASDILYGANNRIPGLKVYSNFGAVVSNSFRVQHVAAEDEWTTIVLTSDFTTSVASAQATALAFAPEADASYEIEGQFMVRTATATVAPRPGIAWPTGMTDGVGALQASGGTGFAATTPRYGNVSGPVILATVDVANNTGSFPVMMKATLVAGGSPSDSFTITLESEIAATNVTMRAGSWIKYRRIM